MPGDVAKHLHREARVAGDSSSYFYVLWVSIDDLKENPLVNIWLF